MSHRWNCPTDYEARRQGERAQEYGRGSWSNPHRSSWPDEGCDEAARAWDRGYRDAEYRVLLNLDRGELERAAVLPRGDHNAWGTFHRDPFRWFIRADDATAEKLWGLVERRTAGDRT